MIGSILRQAAESLFAHPLRSILTALSVTFGTAALFVLLSYVTGVPETTATILRSLGSKEFIVEPARSRGPRGAGNRGGRRIRIRYSDLEAVRGACPSIAKIAPTYSPGRGGPVFTENKSWPWARLSGVGFDYREVTDMSIVEGRWFLEEEELQSEDVALLSLPLVEGMYDGVSPIGKKIDTRGRRFEIIGVFESNASFAYSMLVPYPTSMEMGDDGGRHVSQIAFAPRNASLAKQAVSEIREALGNLYSFDPDDESAIDVKENTAFVEQVEATSLALEGLALVIGALALVLGCLGAANVVGIAVAERTSELGLRKALGATESRIRAEVLCEMLFLSLGGGALGVGLGWLATRALGPLEFAREARLEPQTDLQLLALAFAILVSSAVLSGLPAANRAARLEPAAALRES